MGPDATWPAATSTSDPGRRPILDWERPFLTRLGVRVRTLRQAAGMTQARLAASAGIAERSLRRIEYGERRTRRSTLRRLAQSIAEQHDGQHAGELLADLLEAVGPALAPESSYAERIEARRVRRTTKAAKRFVTRHITTYSYVRGGVVESHVHQRRVTRYRAESAVTRFCGMTRGVVFASVCPPVRMTATRRRTEAWRQQEAPALQPGASCWFSYGLRDHRSLTFAMMVEPLSGLAGSLTSSRYVVTL